MLIIYGFHWRKHTPMKENEHSCLKAKDKKVHREPFKVDDFSVATLQLLRENPRN